MCPARSGLWWCVRACAYRSGSGSPWGPSRAKVGRGRSRVRTFRSLLPVVRTGGPSSSVVVEPHTGPLVLLEVRTQTGDRAADRGGGSGVRQTLIRDPPVLPRSEWWGQDPAEHAKRTSEATRVRATGLGEGRREHTMVPPLVTVFGLWTRGRRGTGGLDPTPSPDRFEEVGRAEQVSDGRCRCGGDLSRITDGSGGDVAHEALRTGTSRPLRTPPPPTREGVSGLPHPRPEWTRVQTNVCK